MRHSTDLLDHATELFPEPAGALDRLHARHARRQRTRRLAAVGTVAVIWIGLAVAIGTLDAREGSVPVQEPSPSVEPTPVDAEVELTDQLPAGFPADFPLPVGTQPIASRTVASRTSLEDTVIQVWFLAAPGSDATLRWFETALPDAGWGLGERGNVAGIWDQHVGRAGEAGAIVIGKEDPDAGRLIHDSDDFAGPWDLYVRMTLYPPQIDGPVHGWPGARANPAGLYSWDAQGTSWMHNPSDEGLGVAITFFLDFLDATPPIGWNNITVDGYDGIYEAIGVDTDGVSREEWAVDIEGTIVSIDVEAPPGTTAAELAEAHAIVESIRVEPQDADPGFRLVFTLPDGWDSG